MTDDAPAGPHPSDFTVLLVDDTFAVRRIARAFLEREGFHVLEAESAEDARSRMGRTPPDCVLLDVMMPEESGLDLLRDLRSGDRWADLPVIMATALGGRDHVMEAVGAGAVDYIVKPLTRHTVVRKVRKAVGLPEPSPEPSGRADAAAADTDDTNDGEAGA